MESYKGNISASGTVFGSMIAQKGPKGEQGKQGEKGDTPQKGIDYYTEQDKQELIEELTADIQNVKDDFNSNVTSKTTEFNNNASSKITEYNSNAAEKINEYNQNAATKIDEYNQNADGLISKVTELEKENALLKSQIPSATVVGETIHLEDSSNMQCDISPIGASNQETREGYNLLDFSNYIENNIVGVTVTQKQDGSVVLNGTAGTYGADIRVIYETPIIISKGTYTFDYGVNGANIFNNELNISSLGQGTYKLIKRITESFSKTTIIFEEDFELYNYNIHLAPNTIFTNFTIKTMIYEGTGDKPYEQYGASPSIEYEAPIESVGDNINLFDGETETGGIETDGSLNTATDRWRSINYIDVRGFDTLTINLFDITNTEPIGRYNLYDENYSNLSRTQITATKTTIDVTNASYFKFWCLNAQASNTTKIKICKGTSTGAYSPYGQGSIEMYNCNENLGKLEIGNYNDTDGSPTDSTKAYRSFIPVLGAGKYYIYYDFNYTKLGISYLSNALKIYDKNNNLLSTKSLADNYIEITEEEIEAGAKWLKIKFWNSSITSIELDYVTKFQVNYNQVLDYTEHQSQTKSLYTQQPFRAIGDVKDRFVKVDGVWYEEHNIARIIFDGTETWQYNETYKYFYCPTYVFKHTPSTTNRTQISNMFEVTSDWGVSFRDNTETNLMYCVLDAGYKVCIRNLNYTTPEDFANWLSGLYEAGTPLYVDYVTDTPELIECTSEQVEVLESFNTYKNVTNISSDSIGELEVFYYKDLETLLGGV